MGTRDDKERVKTRREKLGGYFFDMSKLAFAGMVIGGLTPLFNNHTPWDLVNILLGIFSTVMFACIGNKILK